MNKIVLIILLVFSITLSAQDLSYLKSEDTIYMILPKLHDKTPTPVKYDTFEFQNYSNGIITEYVFTDNDTVGHSVSIKVMLNSTISKLGLSITVKRKSFIKNHKWQIISMDFIKGFRNRDLFFGYLGARGYGLSTKIIYVIEEESLKKKNKKIILRKADLTTYGYMGI